MPLTPGSRLGAYEILGLLGSGGMGQVFRARDTRLDRDVAIKVLPDEMARDAAAAARFEREAKAVARLSHPNILAIHDYSKEGDTLYAVTELLEGETLRDKLRDGAMSPTRAIELGSAIAEGLVAAHERGVIHRDLKPENIFITRDGRVKILDFGLALTWQPAAIMSVAPTEQLHTMPGTMIGTIGYMSPEQIRGEAVTVATDIFAFGCVLYEAISGGRPFERPSAAATLAAVLSQDPPPLSSNVPETLRRIIEKCLSKEPEDRFRAVSELLSALKGGIAPASGRPSAKRLIVLPFRLLRPDPEFDFLAVSLPDAVTTSLTALDSVVVRSSTIGARFGSEPDLKMVADESEVDWIVTGSVLRAGDQLRVSSQLVEAESGSVLWSHSLSASVNDIFKIQDDLTERVVASLGQRRSIRRDVPRSALGYELFLRANQQGHGATEWIIARDLYLRAIDEDPDFAPAHARLGRIQWLLAKYTEQGENNWILAERSLQRALELNPELPLAHRLYAELEIDLGRSVDALERLLERIRIRPNDPELYVALLKACRYCGLLDESLVAHRRARELDPKIASSVAHTYIMRGEYSEALESVERRGDIGYVEPLILILMGNTESAQRKIRQNIERTPDTRLRAYLESLHGLLDNDREALRAAAERLRPIRDPEALYYVARALFRGGELELGLEYLEISIPGFSCVPMLERDPWLDAVRRDSRFLRLLDQARSVQRTAAERYARHSSFI
ncbi:MAG TPA: protein kinase [Thermoanaerobaculia bacterium]|nr:protein kinase [Thermoanaerobaculia bacterium]